MLVEGGTGIESPGPSTVGGAGAPAPSGVEAGGASFDAALRQQDLLRQQEEATRAQAQAAFAKPDPALDDPSKRPTTAPTAPAPPPPASSPNPPPDGSLSVSGAGSVSAQQRIATGPDAPPLTPTQRASDATPKPAPFAPGQEDPAHGAIRDAAAKLPQPDTTEADRKRAENIERGIAPLQVGTREALRAGADYLNKPQGQATKADYDRAVALNEAAYSAVGKGPGSHNDFNALKANGLAVDTRGLADGFRPDGKISTAQARAAGDVALGDAAAGLGTAMRAGLASRPAVPSAAPQPGPAPKPAPGPELSSAAGGSIRNINTVGGTKNCANCAIATDATLAGRPASALEGQATSLRTLERFFGARFGPSSTIDNIGQTISEAGVGARGIVFGSRGLQEGHFFNVINQRNGGVRYLDGQSGGAASLKGFESFRLLRTDR